MKKIEILLLIMLALSACQNNENAGMPATDTPDSDVIYDTLPSLPEGTLYNERQILQMAQNYSKAPTVVIDHSLHLL